MSGAAGGAEGGGKKSPKTCTRCGKEGEMKQCSKCRGVLYCGAECQKEDWRGHKKACAGLARLYAFNQSVSATEAYDQGNFKHEKKTFRKIEKATEVAQLQGRAALGDAQFAASLVHKGIFLQAEGKLDEALVKLTEALEIWRKHGTDHEMYATNLMAMGDLYFDQRKFDLALSTSEEALRIQRGLPGAGASSAADSLCCIAKCHAKQGKCLQACWDLEEALGIQKASLGDKHPHYGRTLETMARVCEMMGSVEKAKKLYTETAQIYAQAYGTQDSRTQKVLGRAM